MAGRGQIAEAMMAQLGGRYPDVGAFAPSQVGPLDQFRLEGYGQDRGAQVDPNYGLPSTDFNYRFDNYGRDFNNPGQGAYNLYNYLYGRGQPSYDEGDTIPSFRQGEQPLSSMDDWMTPLPQQQDPTRLGSGRNSIFAPNSLYQSPEKPEGPADLFTIADQDMRDYTTFPSSRGNSLGPTQQTPWDSGNQSPQERIDDSFFNYIQMQQQQQLPWWAQDPTGANRNQVQQTPQDRITYGFDNFPSDPGQRGDFQNTATDRVNQGFEYFPQGADKGDRSTPTTTRDFNDSDLTTRTSVFEPSDPFRTAADPSTRPTVDMRSVTPNVLGTTPTQSYFDDGLPTYTDRVGPSGYTPIDTQFSGMYTTHAVPDKDIDARRANLAYMKNALSLGRGY